MCRVVTRVVRVSASAREADAATRAWSLSGRTPLAGEGLGIRKSSQGFGHSGDEPLPDLEEGQPGSRSTRALGSRIDEAGENHDLATMSIEECFGLVDAQFGQPDVPTPAHDRRVTSKPTHGISDVVTEDGRENRQ